MEHILVDQQNLRSRWVVYFDLLGFKDSILKSRWTTVFATYTKAVQLFNRENPFSEYVERLWFSDTFIMASRDDSRESLAFVDQQARRFFQSLIMRGIPLRGAMSFGEMYWDGDNKVIFGPALIDAYQVAENQGWIGYVIGKSALDKLGDMGLPLHDEANYISCEIPWKKECANYPKVLPAYIMGGRPKCNHGIFFDRLNEMKSGTSTKEVTEMYERTIKFLKQNETDRNAQDA